MLWRANTTAEAAPLSVKRRGAAFWLVRLALIGAVTGGIVWGIVAWRDRPLVVAEESLESGDLKYAHYLLTKYLQQNPENQRAMALLARVYVAGGNPDAAIELFEQAGGATIEDLRAWTRALLMTEQWSLAIPLLERVGKTSPNDPDVLYELTSCRVRLGNYEDALASASRFANLPGYEARGHVFVAAILRDLGKDNEAVAAYQAALEHDPKAEKMQVPPAQFYLLYGQTLLKLGRAEDALEPLKRSASARETPEVLLELGNAALQLQRLEDAKTAWKRAVQIDPRHAEARESLARAELQQGRAQQAIEWLAPLPDDSLTVETAYLRQRAYTLLKNDELARQWQERTNQLRKQQQLNAGVNDIVRDSPQSFWAQVVRTYRFAQQGNWRQAELMSERLIREAPAEPFVIELSAAVHRRRDLPSLESFPMNRH